MKKVKQENKRKNGRLAIMRKTSGMCTLIKNNKKGE